MGLRLFSRGTGRQLNRRRRYALERCEERRMLTTWVPGTVEIHQGESTETAIYADFNGDGYDDLAIGVPGEDVGGQADAGAVNVIYGSNSGLHRNGNEFWHQNTWALEGIAGRSDRFGSALAAGDFNRDGYDDLAIGIPGENGGSGAVQILYGYSGGLRNWTAEDDLWTQSELSGSGSEAHDAFGSSLAAGDFDRDGYDDLAIGVPGEDWGTTRDAGVVHAMFGGSSGLRSADNQIWHQDSWGIAGVLEAGDQFGASLTVGDFDGDRYDDLAIGVPGEAIGSRDDAGAVNVIYGTRQGLNARDNRVWHQDVAGVEDVSETGDRFGQSLAAGDFNRDGRDDLAIGVPGEDVQRLINFGWWSYAITLEDAGAVNVLYGSRSGVTSSGDQLWTQDSPGVYGEADGHVSSGGCNSDGVCWTTGGELSNGDRFGTALAAADFNGDGYVDLAIGVPGERIGGHRGAGAVNVLRGSASGITANANYLWHQNAPAINGVAQAGDRFGSTLTVGDFNGDGYHDLAIGVPHEPVGGAVNVIYGTVIGLTWSGDQLWHQNVAGILDSASRDDFFGA